MDTGFPTSDAQFDFSRARRRRVLERLASRLRGEPGDVDLILPFDEVVEALGRTGERHLGLRSISLDAIVGTVDRPGSFDRRFRPLSGRSRERWERIADAQRRGRDMPPISVYKVGDLYFVRDGHHRVSVARALGRATIDAYVSEVSTKLGAEAGIRLGDLPVKGHERVFAERVPLPPEARERIRVDDPWRLATLAEGVEAWGFRLIQRLDEPLDRREVARRWFEDEYVPVVGMLAEAGLLTGQAETEAYMRVAAERYRLTRTHEWDEEVIGRLQRELS